MSSWREGVRINPKSVWHNFLFSFCFLYIDIKHFSISISFLYIDHIWVFFSQVMHNIYLLSSIKIAICLLDHVCLYWIQYFVILLLQSIGNHATVQCMCLYVHSMDLHVLIEPYLNSIEHSLSIYIYMYT